MTIKKWNILTNSVLFETPVFKLCELESQSPNSKQTSFFILDIPNWVNVVAITPDHKIVMIRQFRHGTNSITLEIPGGMVDYNEDPLTAAKRELREETGFTSQEWIQIGVVSPNPAIQNNRCTTFLATNATQTESTDFDEHEDIEVEYLDSNDIWSAISSGTIDHSLVVCALSFYTHYRAANP